MPNIKELKNEIAKVVGSRWVADDPAILFAYSRDLLSDCGFYPGRMPDLAVCPGSAEEIQSIIKLANNYRVPVYTIGMGVTITIGSIPALGGIMLDLKRMDKILYDEENMTVVVEPGVTINQFSGEFIKLTRLKGLNYRPWFSGAPGTSSVIGNALLQAVNKIGSTKYGFAVHNVVGIEMVLPDGSLLRTGSLDPLHGFFWPEGPGPTLTYLPFFACAGYGIVTKMIFKLYPMPEVYKSLWAVWESYGELNRAVKAMQQLIHLDVGRGVFLTTGHNHPAYSAESREEARRLAKAAPKVFLVVGLEGTKRKVECEERMVRKVYQEHGGKVLPPELVEVYRGHEQNVSGWAQANSPRIISYRGLFAGRLETGVVTIWKEFFEETLKIARSEPDFWDHPEPGWGEYAFALQIYPTMGGRWAFWEFQISFDPLDFKNAEAMHHMLPKILALSNKVGSINFLWMRNPMMADFTGAYYLLAKKLKHLLDPNDIMAPGIPFPT